MRLEDIQNMYRHDFSSFIRFSFHELYPHASYQHNWHIDTISHYLNQVIQGEIKRLIINLPPRMLKSHCASIAFPAYILGRDPSKRLLYLHSSKTLGFELEDQCFNLMQSRRYRSLFPNTIVKPEKGKLATTYKGRRQFVPIMGRLTGLGSDIIIIDDPISTTDVRNKSLRKQLNNQFDENILQRIDDKKSGAIILVMQRLHEEDLTAHLLSKNEDWVHLNLSAVAMEDEKWPMQYGKHHTRKKGDIIHPARESKDQLTETLISIGGYAFAYQYMQEAYKPRFGEIGEGGVWLHDMREGEFYDMYEVPKRPHGLFRLNELHFMLPRIFGVGEDPIPANARDSLTMEEVLHNAARHREVMLEHQSKVDSGELEF